ncbi:Crp/Fnr family transcriptional regulator [Sphingobacterium sp. T2]|nr:Crp/Fnr family transcriptional regulator [Sphingobacterium sp. T2]
MQALVDCQLLVITKQDYLQIHNILPDWNEVEKHFIIHCFTTLEERIYSHIAMSAEERYQLFFQNNKDLFNQIPLQYIASMLGITPETLSRIRKKLL